MSTGRLCHLFYPSSFWLNGNITREGLTADLEAIDRAGIGGVLIKEGRLFRLVNN